MPEVSPAWAESANALRIGKEGRTRAVGTSVVRR
jgi:hypothetical protein